MSMIHSSSRLRILLVMPDANIHRLDLGAVKISFREAPLTLTTLAALVPPELNASITLVDESVDTIPQNKQFDLVGISCLTGTAPRAYALADAFRTRGITVILGGVHVSLRPEEAESHADSVVTGFAEAAWPQLLHDFVSGNLEERYEQKSVCLAGLPAPRRDLQRRFAYAMPQTVFATRGCHRRCTFCSVPAVPFGWHTRPVGDVVEEIRHLPRRRFAFNDVNLVSDRDYAMELFTALVPLRKKWGGLAPVSLADDHELLDVMRRSGCQYLLLGFESIRQSSLGQIQKGFNRAQDYRRAMEAFHGRNIAIQGCFIFGMDDDSREIFSDTVDTIRDLRIDIPRFAIYTPYPGTEAFTTLKAQGRILHEHWRYYDTQHVVFKPAQMAPSELYQGFRWAYRQTFTCRALVRRTLASPHPVISFLGNAAYRLYVRRLRAVSSEPANRAVFRSSPLAYRKKTLVSARSCLHAGGNAS
jgi:radical SAM superfamily enzyme YgiQ (UPF0313 family)